MSLLNSGIEVVFRGRNKSVDSYMSVVTIKELQ